MSGHPHSHTPSGGTIRASAPSTADLERRFNYHPANSPERRSHHERVRNVCLLTAEKIVESTPPGREQSLALTKLEEAMFWANAAIARQPQ